MESNYNVGVYVRLSKKDDENDISNSIINQKDMIKSYLDSDNKLKLFPDKVKNIAQTMSNCPIKAIYFGNKVSEYEMNKYLGFLRNSGKVIPKIYRMVLNRYKAEFIAEEIII